MRSENRGVRYNQVVVESRHLNGVRRAFYSDIEYLNVRGELRRPDGDLGDAKQDTRLSCFQSTAE
eukprot:m.5278 g.5278  ORF g.5278 m.5278 type:complete len:65 (+) comp12738_c0_seq1:96-290(+)